MLLPSSAFDDDLIDNALNIDGSRVQIALATVESGVRI